MQEFRRSQVYLLPLLLFGIPIVIGVASCRVPLEVYSTPTTMSHNAWLAEWLNEPTCQPPCFLGITPGMTTMTETIQLLSSIPNVQITKGPLVSIDHQELSWEFTTRPLNDGGRLHTDGKGRAVSFIDVSIGSGQNLILAEIVSSFGSPEFVYLSDCRGRIQCVVQLIYMSSGMVIEQLLPAKVDKNNKHTVDISPDMQVEEIWFFQPGKSGYREPFGFEADYLSESQLPWNGYTTYKEK